MAYVYADNVAEESTTTTTGAYQLGGVPSTGQAPGVRTWVSGVGNSNTSDYYAYEVGGTAWERGLGTVVSGSPNTLTRTTIYSSSNSNAAVDWTGKTVRIRCVQDARQLMGRDSVNMAQNLTIVTSRASNAETIALKTAAGADPMPGDPIRIAFRNATAGTGDFSVLEITAATSVVISSGSTLGAANATAFRVWLVGFNDAGTFRLGVIKCALSDGIYGLQDNVLESSTAEGGAGAADSSGVIYTGTAVTTKAMRVLGYLEYTLTTAGTWVTAPSLIQLYSHGDKLPGDTVQTRRATTSSEVDITSNIPADNTIPQNTEGVQVLTQAITPRSATSLMRLSGYAAAAAAAVSTLSLAIFRDSVADALSASLGGTAATDGYLSVCSVYHTEQSPGISAVTYKLRAGRTNGSFYVNATAVSTGLFGGTSYAHLQVEEICT